MRDRPPSHPRTARSPVHDCTSTHKPRRPLENPATCTVDYCLTLRRFILHSFTRFLTYLPSVSVATFLTPSLHRASCTCSSHQARCRGAIRASLKGADALMNTYRNVKAMFVPSGRVLDVQVRGVNFYKSRAHCSTQVEGARAKKGQREQARREAR